jgi:hypothetical protein
MGGTDKPEKEATDVEEDVIALLRILRELGIDVEDLQPYMYFFQRITGRRTFRFRWA